MSYSVIEPEELNNHINLLEGVAFIETHYPYYDKDKLEDIRSNTKYSIQMIENSLPIMVDIADFLKIIIFDALIGNSDRHHSNWGIIASGKVSKTSENLFDIIFDYSLCPLYDNGSSLCSYINDKDVKSIIKDNTRFEALINTKSKSVIGWKNERPIRHFDMINKIKEKYYNKTIDYIKLLKNRITEENINEVLNKFDDEIISSDMKELLLKFIIERKNRILKIYELKDGG